MSYRGSALQSARDGVETSSLPPSTPRVSDMAVTMSVEKHQVRRPERSTPVVGGGWPSPVPGAPRWAVVCAWATPGCVIPSGIWRTLVGIGVPLGWTDEQLRLERIPGFGTGYVIVLTLVTVSAAALTLGLVYPWGDRVPAWVPGAGGRRIPTWLPVSLATAGAATVAVLVALSVIHWSDVSGFADRPRSGWALLMLGCYLPAGLWPGLLLTVTWSYLRRRTRTGSVPVRDAAASAPEG